MADPRITGATLKVLKLFFEAPNQQRSGGEISRLLGLSSGTLYPLLARLEDARWLQSKWEAVAPSRVGRPRRRLYLITALGQRRASEALRDVQISAGELAWNL